MELLNTIMKAKIAENLMVKAEQATSAIMKVTATEDQIFSGLETALGGIPNFGMRIFSKLISPIIAAFMVGILLIMFAKVGFSASRIKETFETHMFSILACVIILIISVSFSIWGWAMLGGQPV